MSVNNPWLTPFQRSFQSIKSKLIESLKIRVPEITDFSEGNIFVIILSLFSAISEVIHYYIDNISRESFFMTARKYSSLLTHSKFFDYHIKSANPARVDVLLTLADGGIPSIDIHIPSGTEFTSDQGIRYISTKSITWPRTSHGVYIPLVQVQKLSDIFFGTITTTEDIYLTLGGLGEGNLYAEGTMILKVTKSGVTTIWSLVDTFAYSKPTSKHFKVEIGANQEPYITFGNGVFGMKPSVGSTLTGDIHITKGVEGAILSGSITIVPQVVSSQHSDIVCINPQPSSGSSNYEDFDMLKAHVPLSIRSLGVAITETDYEDVVKLIPGVDKVYVINECGRYIKIYITPDGGGIAPQSLIDYVKLQLLNKKVLATIFEVYPTNESHIYLDATVTGRKSFKSEDIQNQVVNALMSMYDYNTSDISKPIRLSDIYAKIDGLSMVDYLTIHNLYLKPYPIKVGLTSTELNLDILIENIVNEITIIIRYNLNGSVTLLYSDLTSTGVTFNVGNVWHNIVLSDGTFSIKVDDPVIGVYNNLDMWKVVLQKNNVDQLPIEHSIPIFSNPGQIKLNIIEIS